MLPIAPMLALVACGGAERLRWQVHEIPHVDVPNASLTVINGVSDNGILTGRSGSTQSSVGWHAYTWTLQAGTRRCLDGGWTLSEGVHVNDDGLVAGSVSVCPTNGACHSAAALLSPDAWAQPTGPIEPEFLSIRGLTASGAMVYQQGYANSNQTGAWITDPQGTAHAIPLPDVAFSVQIPNITDALEQADVTMAGHVWATPWRIAMVWRVHFDRDVPSFETLMLPTAGGDASVTGILDDGTVLGGLEFGQYFRPVVWSPPYDTYTIVLPPKSNIASHETLVGSSEGLRAGSFWPTGAQATWVLDADGTFFILGHEDLGLLPGDLRPIAMLPDDSMLLQYFSATTYESTWATWRADTGAVLLNGRLFGGAQVGEHPGTVAVGVGNGTLGLNTMSTAFAAVPVAPGDVNADGTVDVGDVLALIDGWGPCGDVCLYDLDASGAIDVDDLLSTLAQYQ
jgi:hypothetical protein